MWKRNPDRTETARFSGIKCGIDGIGSPMMRSGLPSASICPNSKSYFPFNPQSGGCFGPRLFFGSAASFSQQIPKVICERSCRKAKTLTVNITPILKKESEKSKKIKKRYIFWLFFSKKREKNIQKLVIRLTINRHFLFFAYSGAFGISFDFSREKAYIN